MSRRDEGYRLDGGTHLLADVVLIVAFMMAPAVLTLDPTAAILSRVLALAHAALTAFVAWPPRRARAVSVMIHGATELVVAVLLITASLAVSWRTPSRVFFGSAGLVILIVWWFTDYDVIATWVAAPEQE